VIKDSSFSLDIFTGPIKTFSPSPFSGIGFLFYSLYLTVSPPLLLFPNHSVVFSALALSFFSFEFPPARAPSLDFTHSFGHFPSSWSEGKTPTSSKKNPPFFFYEPFPPSFLVSFSFLFFSLCIVPTKLPTLPVCLPFPLPNLLVRITFPSFCSISF